MELAWAAGGALAGLLAGAGARGTVFRLSVRANEPLRTACARCGESALGQRWFALRCGACGTTLGRPLLLELLMASVLALLFYRFAGQWDVAAFAFLGALGVALATIDVSVQRLPDRLTLPAYPITVTLLAIAAIATGDLSALGRALLGGLALAGVYYLLAMLSPGKLGGGDIKLAGLLGIALGWVGWPALIVGGALGFLLFSAHSLVLLAARRVTLRSSVCFGPAMLAGALLGTVLL